ncbi:type III leader peptidase family protein [Staphylococcus piscifermentans]|nr:type III leader peptidase family protein [Staphylococcus piscifermentans]
MSITILSCYCIILESFLLQFCHVKQLNFTYLTRRSKCESCKHVLNHFDLIPVISFLWLRGRCRYCNCKIPVIHLIGELLAWIPIPLISFQLIHLKASLFIAIYLLLLAAALYDYKTFSIPIHFLIIFTITVLALSNHIYYNQIPIILLLHFLYIISSSSIGYGDIAIFSLLAIVIPFPLFLYIFCCTFIFAGFLAIILMSISKKKIAKIPLIPFIFLAFLFTSIFHTYLIQYFYI